MGCGASSRGRHSYAVPDHSEQRASYSTAERFSQSTALQDRELLLEDTSAEIGEYELSELVLCVATRSDWQRADYLVFSERQAQTSHTSSRSAPAPPSSGGWIDNPPPPSPNKQRAPSPYDRTRRTRRSTIASATATTTAKKCGNFYSRTSRTVGIWKISGNALDLKWGEMQDSAICAEDPRKWANSKTSLKVHVMEPRVTPKWFEPDLLASKHCTASLAQSLFECPICFFGLWTQPVAIMKKHSRRCCSHYIHFGCGEFVRKTMKKAGSEAVCPVCSAVFNDVKEMPDLALEPRAWFAMCDSDFGGELDQFEIGEALGAMLPIKRTRLTTILRSNWHKWDPDGGGTISIQEFIKPQNGLQAWILASLVRNSCVPLSHMPPNLERNPREWFEHWDDDDSGALEKDEILRALARTFCITEDGAPIPRRAMEMKDMVDSLWVALGYLPIDSISFREFARPFGIMDQVLHNVNHCRYFGDDDELVLL